MKEISRGNVERNAVTLNKLILILCGLFCSPLLSLSQFLSLNLQFWSQ